MIEKRTGEDFLVAALGASAGGLEALEKFFRNMPDDAGISFVIVQHLAPDHPTALPELLGRYTRMPVEQVQDNTKPTPNRVYIIPPNATLTIKNGVLRVSAPVEARGLRTPIDSLFSSLAEDRGENAVCIMLSGTGTDGTLGLRAIKEHGGMAMAQALETAKYDAILRSAIGTGLVDHVLPVEEMPAKLMEYAEYLSSLNGKTNHIREQIGAQLGKVYGLIRRRSGHDFSQYKQSTVIRRLERRMKASQIEGVEQYVELLERRPEEVDLLLKDLLIGVTQFFRDPEAFEALGRDVVPKLFEGKGKGESVRACIVGCASGEEAYSIAILLCEHALTLSNAPRVQIFATDIDERALEMARKGRFPVSVAEHVSAERLERFFTKDDGTYQVKRELRELCIFSSHSFIKDPPFSRLNLISCRNVMIYLGVDLQRKIFPLFHYALRSGGYLFLGPSESAASHRELFQTVDKKHRLFQRKDTLPRPDVMFPLAELSRPRLGGGHPETEEQNIPKQLERIILQRYRPACVTVRENGAAVYFSGRTGRYLEHPTGALDTNILNLAREGLRVPLRSALHKAVTTHARAAQKHIPVQTNGGVSQVDVTVEPVPEFPNANLYMIMFEDSASASGPEHGETLASGGDSEEIIRYLENELRSAQEHAQSMYEELESSNEELKSANEEYQSTNEELETSKEELQSFNEELETVNSELNRKVAELDHTSSDLQNLLNGTQIATIFLSTELRIKNFTPAAGSVFRLITSDIGRPITDLAAQLTDFDLVTDINEVLRTLVPRERQLPGAAGQHFQMRILPYRTVHNVIDGVVLTFVDITQIKQSGDRLRESEAEYRAMFEASSVAVSESDPETGRLMRVNEQFKRLTGYTAAELNGKTFLELTHPDDVPGNWEGFSRMVRGEIGFYETEKRLIRRNGTIAWVHVTVNVVRDAAERPLRAVAITLDISERKRTEALVASQKQALEMFTSGAPLMEVLGFVARAVESHSHPGAAVAIHLLDESAMRFEHTAAPSLPPDYSRAIDGMEVRSATGPFCAAVSARQRVVVADVAASEEFPEFASFALPLGIRSGWCTPIFASSGKVLGTVAEYYREPREPQAQDDLLGEIVIRTAAIIIERKRDDEALRRLNVDLQHFAYAASHDLQEPLRMVMSYTQLLARQYKGKLDQQADQFIAYAVQGAERMETLLRDLREYWSVNEQKLAESVPVNCEQVLAKALDLLAIAIRDSGGLIAHDPLPTVMAEETPLVLLFQNLIGNALKYRRPNEQPRIHLSAERSANVWSFSVRDNGIGIEAEHTGKIFAPFKRLHGAEYAGSGIGLAICARVVERYGGRIWVESEYGQGSTFRFTIPAQME